MVSKRRERSASLPGSRKALLLGEEREEARRRRMKLKENDVFWTADPAAAQVQRSAPAYRSSPVGGGLRREPVRRIAAVFPPIFNG